MDIYSQLKRDEGVRHDLYKDSLGNWTFGVGFTFPIDDAEIDFILHNRVELATDDVETHITNFAPAAGPIRFDVLVNMCYNMGIKRLLGFAKFITAYKAGDWNTAAKEMLDSPWAKVQVGPRATRLAEQMRTGVWQ